MLHPIIQQVAGETGMTPPEVCLSWAHQREQNNVGYVAMAERSEWIKSNLACATKEALSNNQYIKINGDGSDENLGINTNNRLIWGQVFFWPEARLLGHDRDLLWNDVQIFETELDYHKFSQAAVKFYEIWKETAVDLRIKYS
jgi:hypothetical protein